MSNHLAIAACTAALRHVLIRALPDTLGGATVTFSRPDAPQGAAADAGHINLFLYQVTPNAAWRNADLPTRSFDGRLRQRPQAALDLWYLLSFFGDEADLTPQRLLGSAVGTLHAHPLLVRDEIEAAQKAFPKNDALKDADLHRQVELIKFSPTSLNLEELSRLWTMFVGVPYALSVTYQASVVLIESEISVQPTLPVRTRNLYVDPFRRPVLDEVIAEAGAGQPILPGDRLIARGRGLQGDLTTVWIDGDERVPDFVSETELRLQLPTTSMRAGIVGVQVVQMRLLGTPPTAHQGVESNVVPIVVRPVLEAAQDGKLKATFGTGKELKVPVSPPVGEGQRVVLLLSPLFAAEAGYSLPALPRKEEIDSVVFDLGKVKLPGKYLARLQVDGAESLVEIDQISGQLARPWVEVV